MTNLSFGVPLKKYTTFKIGGPATAFAELNDPQQLPDLLAYAEAEGWPVLILGGGSNMLVSDRGFDGLVIHISNIGIEQQDAGENEVLLRVGSGEVWDGVVKYAVDRQLWGIENLSRIPGRMGAFAVQNVGAYGPEAKDVVVEVEVFDLKEREFKVLTNAECDFSYRKSIFNTTEKGRYVIFHTTIKLSRVPKPNIGYPDVKKRFEGIEQPEIADIRHAIKDIRDAKFPFPEESVEGNAGSFFKNSVIDQEQYDALLESFRQHLPQHVERLEQIRHKFPTAEGIKIPSAFIMEVCELKGFTMGNVQLNPTQPVVVLNKNGNASAHEVLSLVREVRRIVRDKTGLHLYTEPEFIGFTQDGLIKYGFNDEELARYCPHASLLDQAGDDTSIE
ncbi:MAG TPA: UDP-N-acetylmuramate dehydrogenase [Candidatus Kapabacteria bacterium]|nr:UDP-N-acetylmuramate dehydrogenase [Candidatus Kapabacteria bacterium]